MLHSGRADHVKNGIEIGDQALQIRLEAQQPRIHPAATNP
jgi:hypothetical protein